MRILLLASLLLMSYLPTLAQTDSPAQRPAAPTLTATPDTAAAIHRLFAKRRTERACLLLGTLGVGSWLTASAAHESKHYPDPVGAGLSGYAAIGLGGFTGVAGTMELIALRKASRANERRAIELWRANQLPPEIRQSLKPRHFRPRKGA